MDKYVRVTPVKKTRAGAGQSSGGASGEEIASSEVRITTVGKLTNYVTYAVTLLEGPAASAATATPLAEGAAAQTQGKHSKIVLQAMGQAIQKCVLVADMLRHRVSNLHATVDISSVDVTDTWEPTEEGLKTVETTRHVSVITFTLSTEPLDKKHPGYMAPVPPERLRTVSV